MKTIVQRRFQALLEGPAETLTPQPELQDTSGAVDDVMETREVGGSVLPPDILASVIADMGCEREREGQEICGDLESDEDDELSDAEDEDLEGDAEMSAGMS